MGVAVKKPINTDNKMIIDYAYNNLRTDFMDIYLASQCEFCLTTGTGFDGTTTIFRKPNIYVNFAPLFLLRTECLNMLSIPCYYYSKKFSRNLTISEIVNNESLTIELPSYVSRWAKDFIVNVTAIYDGKIKIYAVSQVDENGKFNVYGENGSFNWIAIGKRDSLIVEPLKSEINVKGSGPYKWIE